MQLTGKQIIERNIVTNHCAEALQQQGVDVRVSKVYKYAGGCDCGGIPARGKTILPRCVEVPPLPSRDEDTWYLPAGYYELRLMEAVKIPNNVSLHFKTRSSLIRCGAIIHSGQFDAGFETDLAGCFLQVLWPIYLQRGARVAQAICFETEEVDRDNLYNGQWQNDKQRNE